MAKVVGPAGIDGKVVVENHGNIAVLRMNMGQNRINPIFLERMAAALDDIERNPSAHVLVTIGEGKFYSNGLDLDYFQYETKKGNNVPFKSSVEGMEDLYERIMTFSMPTIACMNGHAFAGGAMLAASHDYMLMREDRGWFCINEVHLGMLFRPFMREMLRAKLPGGYIFNEALGLGRRYVAKEALEKGIIKDTCDGNNPLAKALELAKTLVSQGAYSRSSMKNMKTDLYEDVLKLRNVPLSANL